jgi:hypothetical protein
MLQFLLMVHTYMGVFTFSGSDVDSDQDNDWEAQQIKKAVSIPQVCTVNKEFLFRTSWPNGSDVGLHWVVGSNPSEGTSWYL